jgi:UDP-glucose 4-epimerase
MAENRKAVVTGGAGFIGSHIADECVKRGWQTTILDNLSTGRIENIRYLINDQNSKFEIRNPKLETHNSQLTTHNSCEFVQGSITDLPLLQKLLSGADYVFHQAAIPSVPRSIENPIASYEANVTGTLNLLIAARDSKVKKVVFASSSSVYGDTPTLPKKEEMLPNPLSPYAANKISAEYHCAAFNKVYHLPTVCLRYFNVYGPRQNPDSQYAAVIPKFIQCILNGKSPVIFGDGEQSRDFTFVQDVAAANILAAESETTGVFNIGTGERITLNQLTRLMLTILGRTEIKPVYEKERAGDIKHSLADITRAGSFGYSPRYTIEKGLRETIKSFEAIPLLTRH